MVCAPVPPYRRTNHALSHLNPVMIISSGDLAHYGVSLAKDWVFVDCGTRVQLTELYYLEMIDILRQLL